MSRPATNAERSDDDAVIAELLAGLRAPTKHLPCKLLYDARGAALFEQICTLEEYYLTRHELALLEEHLGAVAQLAGPGVRVIEPGSGSGKKTQLLLAALDHPAVYVPIDVSAEQLAETADELRRGFAHLDVQPICGDYTSLPLAPSRHDRGRTLVFFPGSTIGNFELDLAHQFISRLGELAGPGALLLLGADSNDDPDALLAAYDDRDGVTGEFDLNVLVHMNRVYGATFDVAAFRHRAVWNAACSRIEMHLVSTRRQSVSFAERRFELARGEPIVTEHCYKHPPAVIAELLAGAGWRVRETFPDPRGWMRLWLAER